MPRYNQLYPTLALTIFVGLAVLSDDSGAHPKEALVSSDISQPDRESTLDAIRRMAIQLDNGVKPKCEVKLFGKGWGGHTLCNIIPELPCNFYSFGISNDYSFDVDVADTWGCQGFAADPTVNHSAVLHPKVTFHSIGAKMRAETNRFPIVTSMPALRKWLGHPRIAILKMDCEGCEYSLSEDVALEDPNFFARVDQFAVEVHVSKAWLNTEETLYSLGLLYLQLESANLKLQHAVVTACSSDHESTGCMNELVEMGYPCGNGKSCHNYLFARTA